MGILKRMNQKAVHHWLCGLARADDIPCPTREESDAFYERLRESGRRMRAETWQGFCEAYHRHFHRVFDNFEDLYQK